MVTLFSLIEEDIHEVKAHVQKSGFVCDDICICSLPVMVVVVNFRMHSIWGLKVVNFRIGIQFGD